MYIDMPRGYPTKSIACRVSLEDSMLIITEAALCEENISEYIGKRLPLVICLPLATLEAIQRKAAKSGKNISVYVGERLTYDMTRSHKRGGLWEIERK